MSRIPKERKVRNVPRSAGPPRPIGPKPVPRRFHQARWDEPIIFELSTPGARGILPPPVEAGIREAGGDPTAGPPKGVRRERPPALPGPSPAHVLRPYDRLSQETLGVDRKREVRQAALR